MSEQVSEKSRSAPRTSTLVRPFGTRTCHPNVAEPHAPPGRRTSTLVRPFGTRTCHPHVAEPHAPMPPCPPPPGRVRRRPHAAHRCAPPRGQTSACTPCCWTANHLQSASPAVRTSTSFHHCGPFLTPFSALPDHTRRETCPTPCLCGPDQVLTGGAGGGLQSGVIPDARLQVQIPLPSTRNSRTRPCRLTRQAAETAPPRPGRRGTPSRCWARPTGSSAPRSVAVVLLRSGALAPRVHRRCGCSYSNVGIVFEPCRTRFSAPRHPTTRRVRPTLHGAHASVPIWMLFGSYNPMLLPIHVFRC